MKAKQNQPRRWYCSYNQSNLKAVVRRQNPPSSIYESKNLEPSKMAIATSSIMNRKLKILVIESRINTYSSSSYKISTKQVNSYKACTNSSYKIVGKQWQQKQGTFSQRRLLREEVLRKEYSEEKLIPNLRDNPPYIGKILSEQYYEQ